MIIIGGGDGVFVVTIETSHSIRNLLGSQPDPDKDVFVDITVGGQADEYPDGMPSAWTRWSRHSRHAGGIRYRPSLGDH